MKTLEQLCIKTFNIIEDGKLVWSAKQGKKYTTSLPNILGNVTVFTNYWVAVPKENFVLSEGDK